MEDDYIAHFNRDYFVIHLDGDPNNNHLDNVRRITREELVENSALYALLFYQLNGITKKEAMSMNACVLKVVFGTAVTAADMYSYLAPKDFEWQEGDITFVVVPRPNVKKISNASDMTIAKVVGKIDIIDDSFEGNYRWIVDHFHTDIFNDRYDREVKRTKLVKKLEAMADRKNTVDRLEKLLGDDEDAKALIAELKTLDD